MRLLLLWLGAATLTRAAHFQDDWVMEYPRPSGAQGQPSTRICNPRRLQFAQGPRPAAPNGIAMGVTSAREVFESQFILDMSLATGVHTDRIVVLNVTEGDVHLRLALDDDGHPLPHPRGLPAGPGDAVEMGEAGVAPHRDHRDEARAVLGDAEADARRTCAHPCENVEADVPSVVRDLTNQTQAGLAALRRRPREEGHGRDGPARGLVALDWDMSLRLRSTTDVVSNPAEHLQQDAGLGEAAEHFEASKPAPSRASPPIGV